MRTIIRNIIPLNAIEVATIMSSNSSAVHGLENRSQARQQRTEHGKDHAGHDSLDRSGEVQPHHQFQLRDRRNQISFVHAARFVVDVQHASADHHRHKHGQGDGAGEKKLHVFDVGIEFDRVQRDLLRDCRSDHGVIQPVDHRLHLRFQAAAHKLVGVVDHQADFRRIAGQNPPRILREE